jgi:hypothetical protein
VPARANEFPGGRGPATYTPGMHTPWADEFERALRSQACARDRHDACSHLTGYGGGLNPRRLRLEFGAMLCKCECHSSCPVTSSRAAVRVRTWREMCSCPGVFCPPRLLAS